MSKNYTQITDEALLQAYQQTGDEESIGELYRRYAHLIYANCLKYLRNEEAAKDMLIQVFEHLMSNAKKSKVDSFQNWIFVMTRNLCLRKKKNEENKAKKQEIWEKSEKNSEIFMENEASWSLYNEEEAKERLLLKFMNELEEDQRKCLQLFYWEKKRYKEIAALTNYTEKQVKSFLQNGKRNLKKLLLESGYTS